MEAANFFPLQVRYFQSECKLLSYWNNNNNNNKVAGDSPFRSQKRLLDQVLPDGDQLWAGLGLVFCLLKTVVISVLSPTIGGNRFTPIVTRVVGNLMIFSGIYKEWLF